MYYAFMLPSAYDQRPSPSKWTNVSWSECHNVVKFSNRKVAFLFRFLSTCSDTLPFRHPLASEHLQSYKLTHPPIALVFCWSFAVVGYFVWWFCQHTLYHLSTHVIISFSYFPSMVVGFFYVYSSMPL